MTYSLDLSEAGHLAAEMLSPGWMPGDRRQVDAMTWYHDRVLDDLMSLLRSSDRVVGADRSPSEAAEHASSSLRSSVDELLGVLRDHPRNGPPPMAAPSDLILDQSAAGGPWRDLSRCLLITAHDWTLVNEPVAESVRRGLIADVAAICAAVALLESDLADAIDIQTEDSHVAGQLRVACRALSAAAEQVVELAVRGPTRHGWTPTVAKVPAAATFVMVKEIGQISTAARALAAMLDDSNNGIGPAGAIEVIAAQAQTADVVGRFLGAAGRDDVGAPLIQYGGLLVAGLREARNRLWSEDLSPPGRARHQARELYWAVRRDLKAKQPTPMLIAAAVDYSAMVPEIISSLSACITSAFRQGAWSIINRDDDDPHVEIVWRPTRATDLPALQTSLKRASRCVQPLGFVEDERQAPSKTACRILSDRLTAVGRGPRLRLGPESRGSDGSRGSRPPPPSLDPSRPPAHRR